MYIYIYIVIHDLDDYGYHDNSDKSAVIFSLDPYLLRRVFATFGSPDVFIFQLSESQETMCKCNKDINTNNQDS